jgi:polyisoprenoid-binding protein YceI
VAQKYYSKTAKVSFVSEAPIEKIVATNNSGYLVVDASNGQLEMSVLIKGFQFEKALMQDHFNENYMESGKYPKAFFKGRITNMTTMSLTKDGTYHADVKGDLTIHGITKPIATQARMIVNGGKVSAQGNFDVAIVDYGIEVPKVVRENIAKQVKVSVNADLQKL